MRPTIPQLDGWQLDALKRAGDLAGEHAADLYEAVSNCSRTVSAADKWSGHTRDAATRRTDEEVDHAYEVRNLLQQLSDEAGDAHRELSTARTYVLGQRDQAVAEGCSVDPAGYVTHPDSESAEAQGRAGVHQLNILSGLDEIERLDTAYGATLRAIQQDLSAIREGQADVTVPGWPGGNKDPDEVVTMLAGMTPDQRATFLAGMSPEAVRQLVIADPDRMGNMNGVPFDTRIAANQVNIRNAIAAKEAKPDKDDKKIARWRSLLEPVADPAKNVRKPVLDDGRIVDSDSDKKPNYQIVRSNNVSGADDAQVDRQFIAFDPSGNGRMIEMYGEMKPGSPGAGVYVPGTGTNLMGSATNQTAAWNLADQTGGPVFLYMDGDFPQDILADAPDPKYAEDMAPRLVEFGRELDREIARSAPGTPVTYVGHSYGGSVVGTAEQLGLRADRVLHASSAGTGVYDMPWNNPNPDVQRYSMTAPGDMIGASQSAPRNTGIDVDIPGIPERNPHGGHPSGTDPDEIPGVTRLDTGYYGDHNGDGFAEPVFGKDGHGKYWDDPDSTAFQNIAAVIAGGEATAYVERGIETPYVDVDLGDDGNLGAEVADAARALINEQRTGRDPYADPRVTDNPELGPRIPIR